MNLYIVQIAGLYSDFDETVVANDQKEARQVILKAHGPRQMWIDLVEENVDLEELPDGVLTKEN